MPKVRGQKMKAFNTEKSAARWAQDPRCQVETRTLECRVQNLNWHPEKAIVTPPITPNPPQEFPAPMVCVGLPVGLVFVGEGMCGCGSVEALYSGGVHFMRCMGCVMGGGES